MNLADHYIKSESFYKTAISETKLKSAKDDKINFCPESKVCYTFLTVASSMMYLLTNPCIQDQDKYTDHTN